MSDWMTMGDAVAGAQNLTNLDDAKIRNRLNAMKMKEAFQILKRKGLIDNPSTQFNPVTGTSQPMPQAHPQQMAAAAAPQPAQPQAMPAGAPPVPQAQPVPPQQPASPEDQSAMRGQKKLASIFQQAQPLVAAAKNDPAMGARINKLNDIQQNDPDIQAMKAKLGLDELSYKWDQDTALGETTIAKDWTSEELESYGSKAPNGQILTSLSSHPGKYRIKFNDAGAVIGAEFVNNQALGKKTHEELIDLSQHGTPEQKKMALEDLEADARFKKKSAADTASAGGAGLSQDAIELEARSQIAGEKPINYGYGKQGAAMRAAVANRKAQIAKEEGIDARSLIATGAELAGEKGGMKDLVKRENLIGSFVKRIDATSGVVLDLAKKINNTNSRLANVPINQLRSTLGSGDLQSLDLALTSLSNEIAKVESGSLGIAAVSVEQAKIMSRIHDRNLSLNDLKKVIETGKRLGKTSMDSIKGQRQGLKGTIAGKPEQESPSGDDPLGLR